jgi:hypothetical protein
MPSLVLSRPESPVSNMSRWHKTKAVTQSSEPGDNGGLPNGGVFDAPSNLNLDSTAYPNLWGLSGGTAAYRSNQDDVLDQGWQPDYAGQYGIKFAEAKGIDPNTQRETVPGSADLGMTRDTGGTVGTDRIIMSDGPVTGKSHDWSDQRDKVYQANPNYSGPVTGGPDYAQRLAMTFMASQAVAFSEQASAEALVSSV